MGENVFFLTKNFLDIFELQGSGNSYGGQPVLVLRYPNPVQMLGMEQPTADNGLESLSWRTIFLQHNYFLKDLHYFFLFKATTKTKPVPERSLGEL